MNWIVKVNIRLTMVNVILPSKVAPSARRVYAVDGFVAGEAGYAKYYST